MEEGGVRLGFFLGGVGRGGDGVEKKKGESALKTGPEASKLRLFGLRTLINYET